MLTLLFALGRLLRLLLRLLRLVVGFWTSWRAPGSILSGPGRLRGGFWSVRTPILRDCRVHVRLQCPNALNVAKPQF